MIFPENFFQDEYRNGFFSSADDEARLGGKA